MQCGKGEKKKRQRGIERANDGENTGARTAAIPRRCRRREDTASAPQAMEHAQIGRDDRSQRRRYQRRKTNDPPQIAASSTSRIRSLARMMSEVNQEKLAAVRVQVRDGLTFLSYNWDSNIEP